MAKIVDCPRCKGTGIEPNMKGEMEKDCNTNPQKGTSMDNIDPKKDYTCSQCKGKGTIEK